MHITSYKILVLHNDYNIFNAIPAYNHHDQHDKYKLFGHHKAVGCIFVFLLIGF